jgi:hypothetical protein
MASFVMSARAGSSEAEPTVLRVPELVVVVAVMQIVFWLLTARILDGGVLCGIYSTALTGQWIAVGAFRLLRLIHGRSLGRVFAATGSAPVAGCVV